MSDTKGRTRTPWGRIKYILTRKGRKSGSALPAQKSEEHSGGSGLRFLPLVPAIILLFGIATAATSARLGVDALRKQSRESVALLSQLLATTVGERLRATPHLALIERSAAVSLRKKKGNKQPEVKKPRPIGERMRAHADRKFERTLSTAARVSGAEFLLVEADGGIVQNEMKTTPTRPGIRAILQAGSGEKQIPNGVARFHTTALSGPLKGLFLVAFVPVAKAPRGTGALLRSVIAFTFILVGVAAFMAYFLARSVHSDVSFVRDRIVAMAAPDSRPTGQPIVVRAVDQVGHLTVAFNRLVERFNAAEDAYRRDLSGALNYERERSDFLAALSHELRTPLNVILGFTEVLLTEVDGPLSDEARENMMVVQQSGSHLRSLINDILDLSALETGRLNLQLKPTDFWSVASDVVREVRLAAESKNLTVTLQGKPAEAIADQLRVRQVVGNLVSNAIKFTREGSVTVEVGRSEGMATICVSDTGPGIALEEQSAVFEEYYQAGDWRSQGAGSGLGLAITRRLVRMHGGRLELRSKLGQGSSFRVLLPIAGPKSHGGEARGPDAPRGDTLRISRESLRELGGGKRS